MAWTKERKTALNNLVKAVMDAKDKLDEHMKEAKEIVDEQGGHLESLRDELQLEYDDMSEKVQEGEKGTNLQELIEAIEGCGESLDNLADTLDTDTWDDPIDELKELLSK